MAQMRLPRKRPSWTGEGGRLEQLDEFLHEKKIEKKDYDREYARIKNLCSRPADMTDTQLRSELMKRKMYRKGMHRNVLVAVLKECYRKESRVSRLYDEVTQALIDGGDERGSRFNPQNCKNFSRDQRKKEAPYSGLRRSEARNWKL